MPLTRANVTAASRIMLPAYVAFFMVVGFGFLAAPLPLLRQTPGLAYVDEFIPLRVVGIMFIGAATLMVFALAINHNRQLYLYALILCFLLMGAWTLGLIAAFFFGKASPTGWAWPAFIATCCVATFRSLNVHET